MSITETTRPTVEHAVPKSDPSAGSDSLNGHGSSDTQCILAVEGQTSPQAKHPSVTRLESPAGSTTAQPAKGAPIPTDTTLAGHQSTGQPAASQQTLPKDPPLLADPLLALAADVLDDLEKVRIANENRLRQLTRSVEDSDGETRGFGLDEAHPDVARLAALVDMLADAEHKAALNLGRLMRRHPLGPWVQSTNGIGVKQGARLIASVGDPYIRPEITREDGTVEPSRPRLVSELWAYAGYHVIKTPVSGHIASASQEDYAADGPGHPGQPTCDDHSMLAGVAPKRQRGQHANWSATAKMRAYLVAVSCMKHLDSPYRKTYDDTREKYAEAVHQVPCVRCGPSGKPAPAGTALSDGHKHARALRAVAKAVLKDLWREARRLHGGGETEP